MNVNISEKTELKLKEIAKKNGKNIADVAGVLLEEIVEEKANGNGENFEASDNGNQQEDSSEYENPFEPFIGMFSSGKTDTSEHMHEILYSEDFDSAEGFSVKK